MNALEDFRRHFADCPLVAIIRGVTPDEVEEIGEALVAGGVRIVEVPLNSPDPLESVRRLSRKLGNRALVGAGTVLTTQQVRDVKEAGGQIVVSPNTNAEVIRATVDAGMVSSPGYFTPTEALAALAAGAHALKLFPAEGATPTVLKAQRAVLPKDVPVLAVGGILPDNMRPWLEAGANGFGLGGGIYKPGQSPAETETTARAYVAGLAA
jgi:2-dehydro-3-deoxyphosphogalactonate aldolase